MKRLFKGVGKTIWRATGFVRRPLSRRMSRFIAEAVSGQAAEVAQAVHVSRCSADALAEETNLLLDSVVRELARLQRQVETLREAVDQGRASSHGGLALAGEAD